MFTEAFFVIFIFKSTLYVIKYITFWPIFLLKGYHSIKLWIQIDCIQNKNILIN